MKRQSTDWKKMFAKDTADKGLLSKIYKELLNFNNKKTQLKNWPRNRHLSKEYSWKISI